VHSTVQQHLAATFFAEYQGLRDELVDLLADEDLDYRVGATAPSLGALCRGIGEVERAYVDSFRTFRLDFGYRHPDPQVEGSVALLASWYADLDRELTEALEQLSEDDINRRIIRSDFDIDDFAPLPTVELDIYREALLIFYGKASVYLRSMGKALPTRWEEWIG
jgi:uncharacterized damage-inducible protein DinB